MSAAELTPSARYARSAFVILAWAFVICVFIQVFLVGLEVMKAGVDESLHRDFAYIYGWLLPAMLLLGRVGRVPTDPMFMTLLLLVLFAVQTVLPVFAKQLPLSGPLHTVNAVAILWLSIVVANRSRRSPTGTQGV